MPKSCIVCSAVASPDILIQYCDACQSAMYCSRACQRIDWKTQHKQICKLLNVGHGDMQLRADEHMRRSIELKEIFEASKRSLDEDGKRFYKLFEESTFEGSRAAALEMRKIAKRHTKHSQTFMLIHSLHILFRSSSEKLSWPKNSPLLVLLQFVDPNVLFRDEETRVSLLNRLADLADPSDISTHDNQIILAKQLIEHGANVNAVTISQGESPLHNACHWANVTNLDFIELLLDAGANPNVQDHMGITPLMYTLSYSTGAAKFLLSWPTTDANITTRSGESFMAGVRSLITEMYDKVTHPDNPDAVQDEFLLRQWIEIEEMLVERGATDTGITTLE
jgi:hypothetical protein